MVMFSKQKEHTNDVCLTLPRLEVYCTGATGKPEQHKYKPLLFKIFCADGRRHHQCGRQHHTFVRQYWIRHRINLQPQN